MDVVSFLNVAHYPVHRTLLSAIGFVLVGIGELLPCCRGHFAGRFSLIFDSVSVDLFCFDWLWCSLNLVGARDVSMSFSNIIIVSEPILVSL